MFRSFFFANSFILGSIISLGKVLTIMLVICLMVNPASIEVIPQELRAVTGVFAIICAGFGLASCCFGLSRVILVAGFWVIAIYCLSNSLLGFSPGSSVKKSYARVSPPPKILPGGLFYEEIPDNAGHIVEAKLPTSILTGSGLKEAFSSYITQPVSAARNDLSLPELGIGDVGFGDMSFNTGVLPDSAFFAKPREKKSYYPINSLKKDTGLEGIFNSFIPK